MPLPPQVGGGARLAMSSYDHFCFLQHIRSSAFLYVNSSAVFPLAGLAARRARRDVLSLYAEPPDYRDACRPGPCALALVLQS